MATFYKYAERQAGDYVNWAEIGKNATDMITEEYRIRDEKKAAIDEEARQLFLKLAEPPTGVSTTAQQKAIEFADLATKQKLNDLRLVKSGDLDVKDYLVRSQNLSDGTGLAFNLIKEYQSSFKTKMDRMNSADPKTRSQAIEGVLMESVEGFGKLENMDMLIDPNTGTVNLGMKKFNEKTGVYEFTNEILPTVHAMARIRTEYNYFDSDEATTNIEKNLGENVSILRQLGSQVRTGMVLSKEDKQAYDRYEESENLFIQSAISNPLDMASVLTDDMKVQGYYAEPNKEKAEKNPKAVYFKTNSNGIVSPEFTEEQKKAAFDYMKTTLRAKIDRKTSAQMYTEARPDRPTQFEQENAERQKKLVGAAQLIGGLYGGNNADIKTSLNSLRDINPNIRRIKRTPDGVEVTLVDDKDKLRKVSLSFYGANFSDGTQGNKLTQKQFIMQAAPLFGGNADWKTAIERGGYKKEYETFNIYTTDEAVVDIQEQQKPSDFSIFGGGMNLPNPTAAPVPSAPTE